VAPNVSIITEKTSFDLLYYPGGSAYVKARREGELSINLRGYSDTSSRPVTDLDWYEVNANGRNLEKVSQDNGKLEITELLTRRIRTLELARELWMEKYTLPLLPLLKSPPQLARTQGYSLWGEELEKRFQFLLEYTRRIETTNLRSLENLLTKLEASGDQFQKEINDDHYRAGLNYYLSQLKQRYLARRQQVREMNDLQYYVWILRHGKKKN
jgi:hypothetical protein